MKALLLLLMFITVSFAALQAQENITRKEEAEAIEDNSFFIEESYNQEERVVQHISGVYYRTKPTRDIMYSFTQEWPLFKYKHQISYTIPYSFLDGNAVRGIGDVLINYRYQLFYKDNWACVSPRLSLILPTGSFDKGLGYNVWGWQLNLPVSRRLSDFFVIHVNAGVTMYPGVKGLTINSGEVRKTLMFYNFGGSLIWLARKNFNIMAELLDNVNSDIDTKGNVIKTHEIVMNPGLRWAINWGRMQIVPGLSVPFFFSSQHSATGMLFYLSFEHPY